MVAKTKGKFMEKNGWNEKDGKKTVRRCQKTKKKEISPPNGTTDPIGIKRGQKVEPKKEKKTRRTCPQEERGSKPPTQKTKLLWQKSLEPVSPSYNNDATVSSESFKFIHIPSSLTKAKKGKKMSSKQNKKRVNYKNSFMRSLFQRPILLRD